MSKQTTIEWCERYVHNWSDTLARPGGWHWKNDPVTNERILFCGTQIVRETDCKLKDMTNGTASI